MKFVRYLALILIMQFGVFSSSIFRIPDIKDFEVNVCPFYFKEISETEYSFFVQAGIAVYEKPDFHGIETGILRNFSWGSLRIVVNNHLGWNIRAKIFRDYKFVELEFGAKLIFKKLNFEGALIFFTFIKNGIEFGASFDNNFIVSLEVCYCLKISDNLFVASCVEYR